MCFVWPENIGYLLLLIPLAVLLNHGLVRFLHAREEVVSPLLASNMMPPVSFRLLVAKKIMLFSAIALALFAMTGPRLCNGGKPVLRKGVDIVFMLDVSRSMAARDVPPDRLGQAKEEIMQISRAVKGGRRALLLFAGEPFVQCPLTTDGDAFDALTGMASPDLIEDQGTDYRPALDLAGRILEPDSDRRFSTGTKGEKIIVLVSDGEDHPGDFKPSAVKLKKAGVHFFVIGVGMERPSVIPLGPEGTGIKRDAGGRVVTTSYRQETLRALTAETDGAYFRSTSDHSVHGEVSSAVNRIAATSRWVMQPSESMPLEHWFLAGAFALLFAETVICRGKAMKR
ncbi:MAG: VWA domain-containing protein [Chlorobiaceae bacterium]|nr:VWA domain-containing protein [Chlorobiaceae bacterium]